MVALFIFGKLTELGLFYNLSWWWILLPLGLNVLGAVLQTMKELRNA
jgi:hypothetical protein